MPKLPHDRVLTLHAAAIECGMANDADHRRLLLGFSPGYVAGLPADGSPSTRLHLVLDRLNQDRTPGHTGWRLDQWLMNAVALAREQERLEEVAVFEAALQGSPAAASPGATVLRLLFLAAQPEEKAALNAGAAHHAIEEAIASAGGKGALTVASAWAVRPADVQRSLHEHRPHLLHFHAHGDAKGRLLLEAAGGQPQPVRPEAIAGLLRAMETDIRLVFFAACHSESLAEAAASVVGLAIGMGDEVEEKAATQLSASFYGGVAMGLTVQRAFDEALAVVGMHGLAEQDKPRLCRRPDVDPAKVVLLRV
jgi:hypothetical protein